ncbi:hypothetical protein Ferp_1118 [Ferroglobus placidus DSM 10642]|uniref:Uncharacterized protein n=1 Tax=Ferroglobus placidus (strain DSM 10642 / AEDII12DO) TaxID=589924 RepID=D3RXR4_FERPA|nr:type IV pilin [Ferroglobus placidus]ADC65277.1 hypothetical protein Ferp_1118 [Ferroglobus placidus DSM 10642]
MKEDKALTPTFGVLLALAITVLLSAMFYSGIDFSKLKEPIFAVLGISEKITPHEAGLGNTSQIVKIYNNGGDSIYVGKVKLVVKIYRDGELLKQVACQGFPVNNFSEAFCSGDDIIDESDLGYTVLGELHKSSDGYFSSGEFIGFRIKSDSVKLERGDVVQVEVIDIESGLILAKLEKIV